MILIGETTAATPRPTAWLLSALVGLLALTGCGAEAYNSRLQETAKYFEYLETLNRNLARAWGNAGVDYRAPLQFREIPPPKIEKDEEGNVIEPEIDPRQPAFIDGELPGLIGAWKADVSVGDGATAPASIFILSNYPLWLETTDASEIVKFHDTAVRQVSGGMNLRLPDPKRVTIPAGIAYTKGKQFTTYSLPEKEIDGIAYHTTLYAHQAGDARVVLVFVIPARIDTSERIGDRIEMSLETLTVTDVKPPRPTPGGKPGAEAAPKRAF